MDLGAAFLNPIEQTQRIQQQEAMGPAELAHKVATTRMINAEAGTMEYSLQGEKAAAALMAQRMGEGSTAAKPKSISDMLYMNGEDYAKAGLPNKAVAAMQAAGLAANREAQQRASEARTAAQGLNGNLKIATAAEKLFDGVKDQAGYDAANQAIEQLTGKPSPLPSQYDPKLVERLQGAVGSTQKKAELELKKLNVASEIQKRVSDMQHQRVMEGIAERRAEVTESRAAQVKKVAGAKDVGAPRVADIKQAGELLAAEHGLVSDEDMKRASYDVAAQAQTLRKMNPGMSADDAMRKALAQKKASGDFQVEHTPGLLGTKLGAKDIPSYKPGKPGKAEAAPAKDSDREIGKTYVSPKGGEFIWTAKGWKPVSKSDDSQEPAEGR